PPRSKTPGDPRATQRPGTFLGSASRTIATPGLRAWRGLLAAVARREGRKWDPASARAPCRRLVEPPPPWGPRRRAGRRALELPIEGPAASGPPARLAAPRFRVR